MNTLPSINPHPILKDIEPHAGALMLVPPVASAAVAATADITFGSASSTYAYHPRKVRASAAGAFVFQLVGDSADRTINLSADEEFIGWIAKIDATTMDDSIVVFW